MKFYVKIYKAGVAGQIGTAYPTLEIADQMASRGRLHVIEVDPALRVATKVDRTSAPVEAV